MEKTIDIIVPIDGQLDDLKLCISSILSHTNLNVNRLILISGNNIDSDTKVYLDSLHQPGIYKCHIEKIPTFSIMVNWERDSSEGNDILLLYPDTIVCPRWLEKLTTCAYSDEGVGIVSPLNNFIIDSDDSHNLDPSLIDEYSNRLEEISLYQYPTIPVETARCMFIKRSVLDDVSIRKSSSSKIIPCNEKEFCSRATQMGYRQVLCDSAFVYCKRPNLPSGNSDHLKEFWGNSLIKKNIDFYENIGWKNTKKNILYLVQADFREGCSNNIGGTQLHVKDLVNGLKSHFNLFVAARDGEFLRVTAYVGKKVTPLSFYIGPVAEHFVYRDNKLNKLFTSLLAAFRIYLVHIHHTMGLTLELYYSAAQLQIPIYTSLHDYYFICPTLKLLDINNESCIGLKESDRCSKCLKSHFHISEEIDFIKKWRKEYHKALDMSEKIFIPSCSAEKIVLQYYPDIKDKIQIIPHGIDSLLFNKKSSGMPFSHTHLHIAFVGGLSDIKGSSIIYDIITSSPEQFEWFIFGGIGDIALNEIEQKNLTKTGWYQREKLQGLLQKYEIDIVCLLSIVEETYCYTLSEVVACGLPVIATDIGALGERTKEMGCGWLVPPDICVSDFLALLNQILNDRLDYEKKRQKATDFKIKTNSQMVADYQCIYEKVEKRTIKYPPFDAMRVLKGYLPSPASDSPRRVVDIISILKKYRPSSFVDYRNFEELMERNQYLEQELSVIYNSNIFKYMQKLAKILDRIKQVFVSEKIRRN